MTNDRNTRRNMNFTLLFYISFGITIAIFLIYGCSFAGDHKKVLYISSYHPEFPTFFQQVEGIKTVFDKNDILLDIEFMDTKRFPQSSNWKLFEHYLTYKLEQADPYDAVMVADDNALIFAIAQQTALFNGKPIVFLGVNDIERALDQDNNPQITGVVESVSMEETIELMIKLRPGATTILALVDNTSSGQGDLKLFYQIARKFGSQTFSDLSLSKMSWPEFLNALRDIGEDSSVLLLSAYQDKNEKTVLFDESLRRIKENLSGPLFHLWYHGLGDGILGGKIISHTEQGKTAADMVLQILNGKPVEEIKVVNVSPNQYVFDYIELKKNNLNRSLLPENSLILNEPRSFYQVHKPLVWSVVVIIAILSISLLFSIVNIYRRKEIQQILKNREAHLRTVMETIPDLIWLKDIEGIYLSCNLKFERFFGAKESEIAGKTDYDFVDKETADFFRKHDKIAMAAGKPSMNIQEVTYADDGHAEILEVLKTPMYGADGKLIGVLGIARDITMRKHEEEEKLKIKLKLQQSQKMEAIGTLAGGIAHDFNNILSPILGYSEILLDTLSTDNPVRKALDQIYSAALRAKDLVKQILTFSRQGSSEFMLMAIQPIIKEALKLIRATIPSSIEITHDIRPDCGLINADPTQIHQIIMNLTTNAYHAMEESGGQLRVTLREMQWEELESKFGSGFGSKFESGFGSGLESEFESEGNNAIIQDMTPGNYACLTVSDTGTGIPDDVKENIFDPFFTTKAHGKGTGMGLSVVQGIVKSFGGAVQVFTESGKGTEFRVYLPISETTCEDEAAPVKECLRGGSERILIVDDEVCIIAMQTELLGNLGYQVIPCSSSIEALDIFRSDPDKFDLVITDMAMPGMSGDTLSLELTRIRPDIPIILCTGFSNIISEEKALSMGIKGFLLKPILLKELSEKIRDVLDIPENQTQN